MASFGRPTTLIRRFPGTTAGTVSAADVVDDVPAADSTPSSARACTAPKQAIFPAKSHQKPIKTRPKRPKGPRPAHSHTQPPGTLVSIFSHMPRMHVDRAGRGRNYCVSPHRGVTRPVLSDPNHLEVIFYYCMENGPRRFFKLCEVARRIFPTAAQWHDT